MARSRRARACRPPHTRAGRGHLRTPDVGVLRALRHARRRPRRPAQAAQGRLPGPGRPRDRARHHSDDPPPARARPRGPRGTARVRAVGRALELVLGAAWDAALHARPAPGQVPALGRAHGGVLRPRLRRLLGGPHGPAVVRRRQRHDAARAAYHGRGGQALLERPLAPALPFAARQSVCSHALTPLRYVSYGSPRPVSGRARACRRRVGVRAHARFRARLPGRALRRRPARRPRAGGGDLAGGAARGTRDPHDRGGRASTGATGQVMAAEDRRYLEEDPRLRDEEELDLDAADELEVSRFQALLQDKRKIASGIALVVLLIVAIYVLFPKIVGADEAVNNLDDAIWYWVVVAIGFNVVAFGAYVALFRGVLGGTRDDEIHRRLDLRVSYQITMAGLAATRIFSAAGVGGIVVTYWALRKAGMPRRRAACRMVAFLVLTYFVYLAALVIFGVLVRVGVLHGEAPLAATVVPAAIAGGALLLLCMIALIPQDFERRIQHYAQGYRRARYLSRVATVPATLAMGTRTALAYIRHPRRGVLALGGAVGFWAANIGILWASFKAFGGEVPFGVLVQGFFVGMAANLIPSPAGGVGAVDAGMIGAFALFGIDEGVVFPAVLTYRVIAFWLPIPPGIVAFIQLRKTVAQWDVERGEAPAPASTLQKVK